MRVKIKHLRGGDRIDKSSYKGDDDYDAYSTDLNYTIGIKMGLSF